MKSTASPSNSSVPLTDLQSGDAAWVAGLDATVSPAADPGETEALLARLRDLGFVAGARCEIVARMWFGGDPVAVRIGGSMFALRRAEAAAVRVLRLREQATESGRLEAADTRAATA